MKLFYSDNYLYNSGVTTTRKAGAIAQSLVSNPIAGVEVVAPRPVTAHWLNRIHDPAYVSAVETGVPRDLAASGLSWSPKLWDSVTASTGGIVEAAILAYSTRQHSGSLSSGLHHAKFGRGSGFCTFNGLALAAMEAEMMGARPIILDLDAHCGGGTTSLINRHRLISLHLDVSVSRFDDYRPVGPFRLAVVHEAERYLSTVELMLEESRRFIAADLLIYNAGMDPFEDDGVGGLDGITEGVLAAREALVFGWAAEHGIPVAFALAGGYTADEATLVRLHRLTISEAAV